MKILYVRIDVLNDRRFNNSEDPEWLFFRGYYRKFAEQRFIGKLRKFSREFVASR